MKGYYRGEATAGALILRGRLLVLEGGRLWGIAIAL